MPVPGTNLSVGPMVKRVLVSQGEDQGYIGARNKLGIARGEGTLRRASWRQKLLHRSAGAKQAAFEVCKQQARTNYNMNWVTWRRMPP